MWILVCIVSLAVIFLLYGEVRDFRLLKTVTDRNRGTRAERKLVLKLLRHGIPAGAIFHDLYVKKPNGTFSQIDLAVATRIGILVFEVKDYSGWIFGAGHQTYWTKILAYGRRKYRFYNPVMQNNGHINDLKRQLRQFQNIPFYSIIVFYGNCVLKNVNYVPNGTYVTRPYDVLQLMEALMLVSQPALYTNKNEIVHLLRSSVENGKDKANRKQHVINVRAMLGKI